MKALAPFVADMRQKRLWPLAALLLVALVAIPVLWSKSSSPVPVAAVPSVAAAAGTSGAPAITKQVNPISSRLDSRPRDPFTGGTGAQVKKLAALARKAATPTKASSTGASSTGSTHAATASTTSPTAARTTAAKTSATTTTTPATTTPATTTTTTTTATKPAPAPGLAATEVYDVAFSMTNAHGGFDTVSPLERLSVLPSPARPLLVELGVLKGGKRVLFAVGRRAAVSGAGNCIPARVDCEVLSLAPGQFELLAGDVAGRMAYSEFTVRSITKRKLASAQAAMRARSQRSSAGSALLRRLTSPVLTLLKYVAGTGAISELAAVAHH